MVDVGEVVEAWVAHLQLSRPLRVSSSIAHLVEASRAMPASWRASC
jgi:hypothetical protein